MPLTDQQVHALLVASSQTRPEEIDCDQFLAAMPAWAEARVEGRAPFPELAAVAAHERLCVNCREECLALVELLTTS